MLVVPDSRLVSCVSAPAHFARRCLSRLCTPLHAVNRAVSMSGLVFMECAVQTFAWKIALILLSLWCKNPKFLHSARSRSLAIRFPSGPFQYTRVTHLSVLLKQVGTLQKVHPSKIVLTFLVSTTQCIRSLLPVSIPPLRHVTEFPVLF